MANLLIIAADAVHPEFGKLQAPDPQPKPKTLSTKSRMKAHKEAIRRAQREIVMFQ